MNKHPEIARAIAALGSQAKLSELSGLSQQHISKLLLRQRIITAGCAIAIEKATEGKIGRYELRPDYWEAPKKLANRSLSDGGEARP